MSENVYKCTISIIESLAEVCKNSTHCETAFPMIVIIHSASGKDVIIPVPSHATPAVASCIGKQIMNDFMKFPGVEDHFTKEQLAELEVHVKSLSEVPLVPIKN